MVRHDERRSGDDARVIRRSTVETLAIALLLTIAALLLGASWQRWLDPII
ncbi:MAG: hypothetical protein JWO56_1682, partial [Acidobacteria bacterium]|nr:hypothetical protein [Acidobacteriota bacterium]